MSSAVKTAANAMRGKTMRRMRTAMLLLSLVMVFLLLGGCVRLQPYPPEPSAKSFRLHDLPAPSQQIVVAVYDFPDLTGQHRQTASGQAHFSKAVTQGASAVLIRALQDAGRGQWFRVAERNRLDHVLTERRIIREQRQGMVDAEGRPLPPPQPLLFAGVIFEGGIIGYDTNTLTGGAGARFLGIGASTRYREDTVTIFLRAVSSQTGEVWRNVVVSKKIYSVEARGDVFRFISSDEILEVEAGFTRNEPRLLALQQAIEQGVYAMVMEGADYGLWSFANQADQARLLGQYYSRDTEPHAVRRTSQAAPGVSLSPRDTESDPAALPAGPIPTRQSPHRSPRPDFWGIQLNNKESDYV